MQCTIDYTTFAVSGNVERWFNHTSWVTAITPTDRPKSVRNSGVIKVFGGGFMLSRCFLDFSVGVGVFVTGLSQISYFFSCILGEGRGMHKCINMYGNIKSAFPTKSIDEYLRNLVGMKCSWSLTSVVVFRPDPSRADPGRGKTWSPESPASKNFLFRPEGYSGKPNA